MNTTTHYDIAVCGGGFAGISAALAAAYPDIPEDERLAEAMRAVRYGDYVLGFSYVWTSPAPYKSAHMGEFVYQEETDYQTLLINVIGE